MRANFTLKLILLFIIFLFSGEPNAAQSISRNTKEITTLEDSTPLFFAEKMRQAKSAREELFYAEKFDSLISLGVKEDAEKLKSLGIVCLTSKSSKSTFYSYQLTLQEADDFSNVYRLTYLTENKKGEINAHKISALDKIDDLDYGKVNPNYLSFFPGLFYELIDLPGKNKFLLLGYNNQDPLYNFKFIETVQLQGDRIKFGMPFLKGDRKKLRRFILQYSKDVSVSLNYKERDKLIYFSHLTPSEPQFTGNFAFYGPDGSYDGFKFEKKQWNFIEDLDFRADKKSNKKYNAPPKTPGIKKR
jgi:hypothetical protein